MIITDEEKALIDTDVEVSMDGRTWWKGKLLGIIDLFVPYRTFVYEFNEARSFMYIRKVNP